MGMAGRFVLWIVAGIALAVIVFFLGRRRPPSPTGAPRDRRQRGKRGGRSARNGQ